MPRYAVSVSLGTYTIEVEAEDADAAIDAAVAATDIAAVFIAGTWEVREVADDV